MSGLCLSLSYPWYVTLFMLSIFAMSDCFMLSSILLLFSLLPIVSIYITSIGIILYFVELVNLFKMVM